MKQILIVFAILVSLATHAQLTPFYSESIGKYGYKDSTSKVIIAPIYDLAYPFVEGMAAVRVDGKYGYLDQSGKEIVSPKYDFTWHFIGGYATVKLGGYYGFIDKTGREIIPPKYQDANNFHGACCYKGMALMKESGKWKIIKL